MRESQQRSQTRIEVVAAFVLGIALPLLEVARRRTDFSDPPAYLDDFVIGGALVYAAWTVHRGHPAGYPLLAAAWGALCGGLWYSVSSQFSLSPEVDVSGLPSIVVLAIKLSIYAIALGCLAVTIRRGTQKMKEGG